MSLRQFSRAFRAQTSTTPARVVERLRADLARGRIETTAEPVERIAEAFGFGDAEKIRRACIGIYGQPPQSIRRALEGSMRGRRPPGVSLLRRSDPLPLLLGPGHDRLRPS